MDSFTCDKILGDQSDLSNFKKVKNGVTDAAVTKQFEKHLWTILKPLKKFSSICKEVFLIIQLIYSLGGITIVWHYWSSMSSCVSVFISYTMGKSM